MKHTARLFLWLTAALLPATVVTAQRPAEVTAQRPYFVDGYHGGIYGHYPVAWQTRFMVDKLAQHPAWRIGLEIEPETWDTVQVRTPEAYAQFRRIAADPRVEFTNPAYAQPYCYNISGESIIRQFEYGIRTLHRHFPDVRFTTYAVEEPCFTSCLPAILKLFGFKYAVLKCPNTCWGGYSAPYGGELVNWVGPDGTSILTVPRYACEALEKNSVWQTTAWGNAREYLDACRQAGIAHPVGMCYQDAGWRGGPWLGSGERIKGNSVYTTWREYIEQHSVGTTTDNYRFTQEEVLPNLMWGSQVMQRIGQEVRAAENRIITAEKLGAMAHLLDGYRIDQANTDEAWRTLLLSQHHDSWIVPYNRLNKQRTWAEEITRWTDNTLTRADRLIDEAVTLMNGWGAAPDAIRVYNPSGSARSETVSLLLPARYTDTRIGLRDANGKRVDCRAEQSEEGIRLYFRATPPAFGFTTYTLVKSLRRDLPAPLITTDPEGRQVIENDLYRIVVDPAKGGAITELTDKRDGKNYVDPHNEYAFGELRGFFYDEGRFRSSVETPAHLTILRDNGQEACLRIEGEIASHPFTQLLTLRQGDPRIDFDLTIGWRGNVGIGEYKQQAKDINLPRRAFSDDRYKLNLFFPTTLRDTRLYKDAPFDVCESRLDNTFFNSWDSIKHNIILHWIDLKERDGRHGLAIYTDHTTSYSYGTDYPPALTVQYSGVGLWGRNYDITRPTHLTYALVPHRDRWDRAGISALSDARNEPLLPVCLSGTPQRKEASLLRLTQDGYRLSAVKVCDDGALLVRLFNAAGDEREQTLTFGFPVEQADEVDLNGAVIRRLTVKNGSVRVAMARFGIKTVKLKIEN